MSELKKLFSSYAAFNREHYYIGALVASAVAAVIICTGNIYPVAQIILLPLVLVPVGFGIFSVVCAVKSDEPIWGFIITGICFSAGFSVGNEIMHQVQKEWAPHTVMTAYHSVPDQPNLGALDRDQIIKHYVLLYEVAVKIERENQEMRDKLGIGNDAGTSVKIDTDGVKIKIHPNDDSSKD